MSAITDMKLHDTCHDGRVIANSRWCDLRVAGFAPAVPRTARIASADDTSTGQMANVGIIPPEPLSIKDLNEVPIVRDTNARHGSCS